MTDFLTIFHAPTACGGGMLSPRENVDFDKARWGNFLYVENSCEFL